MELEAFVTRLWFPRPDETFVYAPMAGETTPVVLLIPNAEDVAPTVIIDGVRHQIDEERTQQVRMHIRAAESRRAPVEDSD